MVDEVVDTRGRLLMLRRLSVLDRLRLFEAAGPELSRNDRWLGLAVLAASVAVIDGVPVPLPASKAAIEAAVQRLDEAGLAAVAAGLAPDGPAHQPGFDKALAGN
jgi:hypothetical protein